MFGVVGAIAIAIGLSLYNLTITWADTLVHDDDLEQITQSIESDIDEVNTAIQYLIAESKVDDLEAQKHNTSAGNWSASDESMYQFWLDRKNKLSLQLFNDVT
jgi:hypothetical protein